MKTTLRAKVEMHAVTVVAELAPLERRADLALLCQAAAKQGVLDPQVIDRVLPGLSETARGNLRRHVEHLGLCNAQGQLTEVGRQCAESFEAPMPEQGVYTFWVVQHPLCGARLLHFRREKPDSRALDYQELTPVPEWFRANRSRAWRSVVDSKLSFCVRELLGPPQQPVKCRLAQVRPCQLVWEIDLATGVNKWALSGHLEWSEQEGPRRSAFTTSQESVPGVDGLALFSSWERRWRTQPGYVEMDFDGKLEEGGHPFRRHLSYPSVTVPNRGSYTDVEVRDVPVGPNNQAQAQRWADTLLRAGLERERGYVHDSRLRELFAGVVSDTPLQHFRVTLNQVEQHLQALDGQERLYWMLAAPLDLRQESA